MDVLIYLAIPFLTVIIAFERASKGKKSFLLLTIVLGCFTIFNTIALVNALGNGKDTVVYTGIKIVVVTIIIYFVTLYMTEKEAKKHNDENDKQN